MKPQVSKSFSLFLTFSLLFWGFCQSVVAGDEVWIDVRSAEEFAAGHVPQAVNIPYEQIAEGISGLDLDSDQTIYLYCGSGRRAGIARESLQELGYQQVVNVGSLEDARQFLASEEETESFE